MTLNQTQMIVVSVDATAFAVSFRNELSICISTTPKWGWIYLTVSETVCSPNFRAKQNTVLKDLYYQAHTIQLHCTCRMPELDLMFQYTKCQLWFYPIKMIFKYRGLKHMWGRTIQMHRTTECIVCGCTRLRTCFVENEATYFGKCGDKWCNRLLRLWHFVKIHIEMSRLKAT